MKIIGSAIRQGNVIEVDGKMWRVIKHNIVSPGKGGAFNQIEVRDVKTGTKSNMNTAAPAATMSAVIVIVFGAPMGVSGSTNTIRVHVVG